MYGLRVMNKSKQKAKQVSSNKQIAAHQPSQDMTII